MHLFEVITIDGVETSVFAQDSDLAAMVFAVWHVANEGRSPPNFEILQRNPRWPGLNTDHLNDALARNVAGVGRYDPHLGWSIDPVLQRREEG